jgi:hypothetical protein
MKGIRQAQQDISDGLPISPLYYTDETLESYLYKRSYNDYIEMLEECELLEIYY